MSPAPGDRLQGTLDLLILRTLAAEPMHGWGISQRLLLLSRDLFQVNQGSLYPALRRLEDRGWIAAAWGVTPHNRRARYYRITPAGRRQLKLERRSWDAFAGAVARVLEEA